MKNREDQKAGPVSPPWCGFPTPSVTDSSSKKNDNKDIDRSLLEGTVSWIGKDSESQPIEYLEECNTFQNGE